MIVWLIVLAGCAIITIGIYLLLERKTPESRHGQPCLTFKQFISFYQLCPKRFDFYSNYVLIDTLTLKRNVEIRLYKEDCFYFKTYKDLYKYKMYLRKLHKKEEKKTNGKIYY